MFLIDCFGFTRMQFSEDNSKELNYIFLDRNVVFKAQFSDLVKFIICTLVSRVHVTVFTFTKGHTVPGN